VGENNKQPLMPCHPARARKLLRKGKAAIYRRYPFTIIMKHGIGGYLQPVEIKFDPGSRTTGIALVGHFERGSEVIWAGNLNHRGLQIKTNLESRRAIRHSRRHRKTRYRPARFLNRQRSKGWLPPSLQSRVDNVKNWMFKLSRLAPLTQIAVETGRKILKKCKSLKYQVSNINKASWLGMNCASIYSKNGFHAKVFAAKTFA
jgi:hypothetical protein